MEAGDHFIYIAEAGSDPDSGFEAQSNIRRTLLTTAGGKVLLAARSYAGRKSYLRRCSAVEPQLVDKFLAECEEIIRTRIATNVSRRGVRFAIATTVRKQSGESVASITLVGPTANDQPRAKKFSALLIRQFDG